MELDNMFGSDAHNTEVLKDASDTPICEQPKKLKKSISLWLALVGAVICLAVGVGIGLLAVVCPQPLYQPVS